MSRGFAKCFLAIFLTAMSCAPLPKPGTALTPEQRQKAQKQCIARYTAGGIGLGGGLGALFGGARKPEEALIGAVVGALVGGVLSSALAWGHCMALYSDLESYPVSGAQETAQKTGYTPTQGNVIKIENFSLDPNTSVPGGQVGMKAAYHVLAPEESREMKVKETRSIEYFDANKNAWKELGSVDKDITVAQGTRKADGHLELPADTPLGCYRMTFKVSANGEEDRAAQLLMVKKGVATVPGHPGNNLDRAAGKHGSPKG